MEIFDHDDIDVGTSASKHSYRSHRPSRAASITPPVKLSASSAHIRARAEKAALEAEAKALEEQNALELETPSSSNGNPTASAQTTTEKA